MRKLLTILVLIVESQGPSPTPAKASYANQEKTRPKTTETQTDNKPSEPQRKVASVAETTPANSIPTADKSIPIVATRNQQQPTNKSKNETPADWWARGPTILITIFTGVLALLAYFQWKAMKSQADYMRKGLRISITAARTANRSANAAKQSAEATLLNTKAFVNSERARVVIELIPVRGGFKGNMLSFQVKPEDFSPFPSDTVTKGTPQYYIKAINMGRTVAHLHSYKVKYGPPHCSPERIVNLNIFLAPNEGKELGGFDLKELLEEVEATSMRFDITVIYSDILTGGSKPHETFTVYHYDGPTDTLERMSTYDRYT